MKNRVLLENYYLPGDGFPVILIFVILPAIRPQALREEKLGRSAPENLTPLVFLMFTATLKN